MLVEVQCCLCGSHSCATCPHASAAPGPLRPLGPITAHPCLSPLLASHRPTPYLLLQDDYAEEMAKRARTSFGYVGVPAPAGDVKEAKGGLYGYGERNDAGHKWQGGGVGRARMLG